MCFCCMYTLLGACVFRQSFGSLADSVLGQLAWQQETHGSLDFPVCDGGAFVVVSETR